MQKEIILEIRSINKSFGGLLVLSQVNLTAFRGEIIGLIGPNGSGKTTLLNVVSGVLNPDSGTIYFQGKRTDSMEPFQICHEGIGRTFQITSLFLEMTVLENLMVGSLFGKGGPIGLMSAQHEAYQILQTMGLLGKKGVIASNLTLQEKKKLELSRALATKPKLLLLDEVMAGLNPTEANEMIDVIRQLNQAGITILIVEHVMSIIMSLSNRVYVLHHGEVIGEGPPDAITRDKKVIQSYLGKGYTLA